MTKQTILLLAAITFLSAETPLKPFVPKLQQQTLSVEKMREQNLNVVQKAVEGIGETLPQKVDKFTTLTKVDSNGTQLIYIFEVDGGMRSDAVLKEEGEKRIAPVVKRGICHQLKRFLDSDIDISYRYLSKATKHQVLKVDVSKKDCVQ